MKENIFISTSTSSDDETSCHSMEQNLNASQEIYSVNNVILDLLKLQSIFSNCESLIKQSQAPDFSEEIFLIETHSLCISLKNISTELETKCSQLLSSIEANRGNIISKNRSELISTDPSDNRKYNDDELRYLVDCGPNHEFLSSYPQNLQLKKKGKQCSFSSSWYKDFPYLEYSVKKDAVFCFSCRLFGAGPGAEKSQEVWSFKGISSWSKMTGSGGKMVKHFKSTAHMSSENRLLNFSQKKTNIDLMLIGGQREVDRKREQLLKLNEKIVITLLDVARFLSRQALSFQGDGNSEGNFVATIDLLRRHDPVLDQWFKDSSLRPYHVTYLHHDSQNELITLLGRAVQQAILNDIHKAQFISVTVDSTTDISNKEIYTIVIRFVKDFIAQERMISVMELNSKVGENISQSYDNALNMSGVNQGVQACLNKHLNRTILYIPCGVHSTNLVVKHGSSISIEYINFFGILQELYNFFEMSAKRHSLLCKNLSETEFGILVKDLSRTRWSDRYEAVRAVYISHKQIVDTLQEISENDSVKTTRQTAENLKNK
ncbi:unnamed protein product [Rotaria sordida]|uniref:TTF-type domain-containing protein n=1 Tax=Rotaria sordida TaxID=392033 RepID=A0A819KY86_9BILA|nr:unnamed protein product [Rotaria sordida]